MKHKIILKAFCFFLLLVPVTKGADLKTCQALNCRDSKKYKTQGEQTQCLIAKRDCHKAFLDTKMKELSKTGVTDDQRKKMLAAMNKARARSEATLRGLKAKVQITAKDLSDLDKKIAELKALPNKK